METKASKFVAIGVAFLDMATTTETFNTDDKKTIVKKMTEKMGDDVDEIYLLKDNKVIQHWCLTGF